MCFYFESLSALASTYGFFYLLVASLITYMALIFFCRSYRPSSYSSSLVNIIGFLLILGSTSLSQLLYSFLSKLLTFSYVLFFLFVLPITMSSSSKNFDLDLELSSSESDNFLLLLPKVCLVLA